MGVGIPHRLIIALAAFAGQRQISRVPLPHAIGFALALLIGLSLGVLGGGGSILTVPIFVYVMEYEPKLAIAMSLPVVGATSLVGAVGHWRAGNFNLKVALLFGVLAMAGAFAGARLSALVSGIAQLVLLAIVMLVSSVLMMRRKSAPDAAPTDGEATRRAPLALVAAAGIGVGILTGLVGIGGGFLFVPALHLLARVPMKTAVGTSLLVIAMNTAAGLAGYSGQVSIPWAIVGAFVVAAAIGIVVGTRIVARVSQGGLRRAFAAFLVLMAAFILVQNRAVLLHPGQALRPSNAGRR